MDLILGKKLYSDSSLKQLHNEYLTCISQEISKAFDTKNVPSGEVCLEQKKNYYNYLHDKSKIEHDNIIRYFNSVRKLE